TLACIPLPRKRLSALLLRSGRRWRAAPDEGASAASCCCDSGTKSESQKHASLRSRPLIRPPGTFSRKREKGFSIRSLSLHPEPALLLRSGRRASFPTLAARLGISPSPAQREKVARSAG